MVITKELTREIVNGLNWPFNQYAVGGGALLAEYGIRDNTNDIDIIVTSELMDVILKDPNWVAFGVSSFEGAGRNARSYFGLTPDTKIEVFDSVMSGTDIETAKLYIERADIRDGVSFVRLVDMMEWKRKVALAGDKRGTHHYEDANLIARYFEEAHRV